MSNYLYGIHDPGGEHLMAERPGWVVHTLDVRSDAPLDYRAQAQRGFSAIGRLNWSHHGQGTIPHKPQWERFARLCAQFVTNSRGCDWWIIGNEPNHPVEQIPDGPPLTVDFYSACYLHVYNAIKRAAPNAKVMPAAIAPWTVLGSVDWIDYFRQMLAHIDGKLDGIALHTYSRGYDPRSVTDNTRMDAPYSAYFNGFRSYLDFLHAVPPELRHLPVHITETNGNSPWPNRNTGFVQAAYAEIDRHNRLEGVQTIYSLSLFRWPRFDQPWQFETKTGVHEDFRAAVAKGYCVPAYQDLSPTGPGQGGYSAYLPIVAGDGTRQPPPTLSWDERLTRRGIELSKYQPRPSPEGSQTYWRLVKAEYLTEKEHIFVNVVDEQGKPLPGVEVICENGGQVVRMTGDKAHDRYALGMVNFPMHAAGWAYRVRIAGGQSDIVRGMGLGTYEEPEVGHHISYRLTFQRVSVKVSAPKQPTPQPKPPKPRPPETRQPTPTLIWPTDAPRTQRWGENPAFYQRALGIPYHNGIDHGTAAGTPVRAMADGEVMFVGTDPGYGNYVRVYHATLGIHTFVAHLQRVVVRVGQMVEQGQVIAYSGATGMTAASIQGDQADTSRPAPHTHTEIRLGERNAYADGTFGHSKGRIDPEAAMYLINRIQSGLSAVPAGSSILDPATLLAFLNVESGAQPFTDGHLTIRFEVHRFEKFLKDKALFDRHFKYVSNAYNEQYWRENPDAPWRHAHDDMSVRHELLRFARNLDDTAALNSTAMGMGQIMGHNAVKAGFDSPQSMFKLFSHPKYGPAAQILGMVNFIRSNHALSDALARRDWYKAVQLYNGVGQEVEYVQRLNAALAEIEAV